MAEEQNISQAERLTGPNRLRLAGILLGVLGLGAGVMAVTNARAQAVDGAQVFATVGCSACHGANGEGGIGPALAGNADLANAALVINQVLVGGGIMPPFGAQLTDDQIAAVANYVRTSWGNTAEVMVQAADVAAARAAPVTTAPATPPA
jgi:mono/diheme cytochrome c family protein